MNKKDLSHYSTAWMGVHKLRAGKNISISSYWMIETETERKEEGREKGREWCVHRDRFYLIFLLNSWKILVLLKHIHRTFFTKSQLKVWIPTVFRLPDLGPWHTLPDLFLSPLKKKNQKKIILMFTLLHYFYYTHTGLHNSSEVNLIDS